MNSELEDDERGDVLVEGRRTTRATLLFAALGGVVLAAEQPVAEFAAGVAGPDARYVAVFQALLAIAVVACWILAFTVRKTVIQVCSGSLVFLTPEGWQSIRWPRIAACDVTEPKVLRIALLDGGERRIDLRGVGGRDRIMEFVDGRMSSARGSGDPRTLDRRRAVSKTAAEKAPTARRRFKNEKGAGWKIFGMVAFVVVYTTTLWRSNLQQAEAARRDREALEMVKTGDDLFAKGKYFDAREKYAEVITHASTTNGGASLGTIQRSALVGAIKCNAFIGGDAGTLEQVGKLRELGIRLDLGKEAAGLPAWLREHECPKTAAALEESSK